MDIYNVSMKSVSKADEGSIHAQITISFKLTCFNNRAIFPAVCSKFYLSMTTADKGLK